MAAFSAISLNPALETAGVPRESEGSQSTAPAGAENVGQSPFQFPTAFLTQALETRGVAIFLGEVF
jgi:hypothetical protein